MEYIIVLMMCILSTAKMSFQSAFSKQTIKNSTDVLVFNICVFIISAVLFLPKVFACSHAVWIYAAIEAVGTILYQMFYTKALAIGKVSMTVLIVNFSMVLNVLASYIFYNESISVLRFCGLILTLVSFIICNGKIQKQSIQKEWLLFAILAMITSSTAMLTQKVFGESPYGGENQAFISCLYIIAAIICIFIYPIFKKKAEKSFELNFKTLKFALATGISLAIFQLFNTYALANIDGTFVFPAQTGGTIIFSTLSGVFIFKDSLNKRQVTGLILGIVALVLIAL